MNPPSKTPAKPGRKKDGRKLLAALLRKSEAWAEACERAKKEKRPVEFVTELRVQQITKADEPTQDMSQRVLWAWPDGTVTSPESLRQRMRNIKHGRAKHGEVIPKTPYEVAKSFPGKGVGMKIVRSGGMPPTVERRMTAGPGFISIGGPVAVPKDGSIPKGCTAIGGVRSVFP